MEEERIYEKVSTGWLPIYELLVSKGKLQQVVRQQKRFLEHPDFLKGNIRRLGFDIEGYNKLIKLMISSYGNLPRHVKETAKRIQQEQFGNINLLDGLDELKIEGKDDVQQD